jgi:hypothetical protein
MVGCDEELRVPTGSRLPRFKPAPALRSIGRTSITNFRDKTKRRPTSALRQSEINGR